MSDNSKITIIICTYNRASLLPETLPPIFNQNISEKEYDVLVVNNNSNDSTNEILLSFVSKKSNLSVINEAQQGLSYARNTGYKNATTEWIVYLDDDAIVSSNFVQTAQQIINTKKYDCFGGIYSPWYKYGKPKWFKDIYASTADYYKKDNNHTIEFASGGIMAIKKSVLNKFDGFPNHMGMIGNTMAYGEETFLQNQMKRHGYHIGIAPEWEIDHIVNRYKLNPIWFIKNGYVSGRDAWIIYDDQVSYKNILKYTMNIITVFFTKFIKITPKLLKNNYYWQNWFIEILRPVSMQYGRVVGGLKLIYNKK